MAAQIHNFQILSHLFFFLSNLSAEHLVLREAQFGNIYPKLSVLKHPHCAYVVWWWHWDPNCTKLLARAK